MAQAEGNGNGRVESNNDDETSLSSLPCANYDSIWHEACMADAFNFGI